MLSQNDVFSYFKQNKTVLLNRFHLKRLGIFGSFARNEQNEESDIDIIADFEDNIDDIYALKEEFRALLFQHFGRQADICNVKYLKSYYKDVILNEAIFF
jgi:predicted nucleotidyltransferase